MLATRMFAEPSKFTCSCGTGRQISCQTVCRQPRIVPPRALQASLQPFRTWRSIYVYAKLQSIRKDSALCRYACIFLATQKCHFEIANLVCKASDIKGLRDYHGTIQGADTLRWFMSSLESECNKSDELRLTNQVRYAVSKQ